MLTADGPVVAVRVGDENFATEFGDLAEVIEWTIATGSEPSEVALGPAVVGGRLLAPIAYPGKMLFCGVNFEDHLAELPGVDRPERPFFFSKLSSSLCGANDDVVIDHDIDVDYEAELALVIGRRLRRASLDEVERGIFGYTAVNDVSARRIQFRDQQITLGKGLDGFCPMGPDVVTADEIIDLSAVVVSCSVNGDLRQCATLDRLIVGVPQLLAHLSELLTLEPGDVVATGTPAGVGYARTPPIFIGDGDVVIVEVSGVGRLENRFLVRERW